MILITIVIVFSLNITLYLYYIKDLKARITSLELEKTKIIAIYQEKLKVQLTNLKTSNSNVIPESTEQMILSNLESFEKSKHFTDKNISIKTLSQLCNTNSKYLSYIINKYKGKNFSNYISELRVNYIITMFSQKPEYLQFQASKLADEAGFISRTAFVTKFKNVTGKSPSQFKLERKDSQITQEMM